ncbi:MAG: hypothetical protein EX285_08210 [Thaumarchaeota archaeon]|nr:hypothetical protein [Nitrososphaerota archaeon]
MFENEGKKRHKETSKYIDVIFNSSWFKDLMASHKRNLGAEDIPTSERAFEFATQQFVDSLSVMITAQPRLFTPLLANSLQPLLELLTTIVDYENSIHPNIERAEKFYLRIDPFLDPKQEKIHQHL